ncbi:MAG: methyltransferase domain-containing protein [Oscillospiraceae bacterium]|nr:methyltransferase domain-containing protein [Oscillospiraceae bacterium]
MSTLTSTIEQYWTRRASSYTEVVRKNLADGWDCKWADELIRNFPKAEGRTLKVLDIGTGPGFYAIILASRGYDVTAVDLSEGMIEQAKHNAGSLAEKIRFFKMDAQELSFPDNEFDVIVTRNLTWNLPDPVKAYGEWRRVLRDGGVMLNIDSNWYAYLFDDEKKCEKLADRENVLNAGFEDHDSYDESWLMENISRTLPMGKLPRPQWDAVTLLDLGFKDVSADTTVSRRLWSREEMLNYASTPCFLIRAVK